MVKIVNDVYYIISHFQLRDTSDHLQVEGAHICYEFMKLIVIERIHRINSDLQYYWMMYE